MSSFNEHNTNFPSSYASAWRNNNNYKKNINLLNNRIENNKSNFALKERVFHQKFGYGIIVDIDEDKVTIDFEKSDIKKLLINFIEKV